VSTPPGGIPLTTDPKLLMRNRRYRVLPVLAAIVGLIVSTASWPFLEDAPPVVIAVVVACLVSEALSALVDARIGDTPGPAATVAAETT
jgi:drug/metabolite transporter (DMT)-like permease